MTTTAGRKPDPADVHVGARIAQLRIARGMTQSDLARLAGPLTFQQFQKYESGANRVSASRLLQVAVALGVPVAYFFDGLPGAAGPDDTGVNTYGVPTATLQSRHGWNMARAYEAASPDLRRVMADVVTMMGEKLGPIIITSDMRTPAEQAAIAADQTPDRRHAGAH
jgi:transcriptional regulator with XRE-family HTH domain